MNRLSIYYAAVFVFALPAASFSDHRRQFPYEAVVEGHDVHARSGPGRNYYPTAKLKRGQKVTVHRHDPGGWYMIAPPVNSFSWIRRQYVDKQSPTEGVLTENNVVVRVGSSFGDDRDIEQVRLSKGTKVQILGEKTFQTNFGAVRMYKIVPPRGEYRWVNGRQLVPTDSVAKKINNRNPYEIPSQVDRKEDGSHELSHPIGSGGGPSLGGSKSHGVSKHSTFRHGPYQRDRKRLAELDARFKAMVEQDASQWDLRSVAEAYRKLKDDTSHPAIISQINHRWPKIKRYRSIQREYQKMVRLTSAIEQRDAELAGGNSTGGGFSGDHEHSHHRHSGPILPAPNDGHDPAMLPTPGSSHFSSGGMRHRQHGHPHHGRMRQPSRPPTQQFRRGPRRRSGSGRKFDGAGILRRVEAHGLGMKYALFSPKGDLLAFVKPAPGLSIEKHLDRPMGLVGQRSRREDIGTDVIVVRKLQPVRLVP